MALNGNSLATFMLVTSSLLAVTANSLLLLVFFRRRGLRNVSNRFVINLLITNLLSSLLLVPMLVVDQENASLGGDFLCYFARATANLTCTASILSILLIGVDQFFAVVHPLRYHFYIDKCKSTALMVACWLFSVVLAAFDALASTNSNFWRLCHRANNTNNATIRTVYSFGYFTLVILSPFLTICAIYVCIYTAAHKNSERMRKSASSNSYTQLPTRGDEVQQKPIQKVQSAPNFASLENLNETKVSRSCSDRTTRNIIISLKYRISNASVFRYREETRAAKISILVIFMVLICYTPYGLAMLLDVYGISHLNVPSLFLLAISNVISPFLFAYRNRRVRRELLKFLRVLPRKPNLQRPPDGGTFQIPEVVVTCKLETEKKSILKRVCSTNWSTYKKCNFIAVPDSCLDARGSFSSASTQISSTEE